MAGRRHGEDDGRDGDEHGDRRSAEEAGLTRPRRQPGQCCRGERKCEHVVRAGKQSLGRAVAEHERRSPEERRQVSLPLGAEHCSCHRRIQDCETEKAEATLVYAADAAAEQRGERTEAEGDAAEDEQERHRRQHPPARQELIGERSRQEHGADDEEGRRARVRGDRLLPVREGDDERDAEAHETAGSDLSGLPSERSDEDAETERAPQGIHRDVTPVVARHRGQHAD